MARVHLTLAFATATALAIAPPASAQEREPSAVWTTEPAPGPPPEPRGRFELSTSAAWTHSSLWDVPIDLLDAQIGIGGAFAADPGGVLWELTGTLSWQRGETQAGRTISGGEFFGIETVAHYRWFRAGVGGRFGVVDVQRATVNSSESGGWLDGYVSIGAEPFALGGNPFFVEAKLHGLIFGDTTAAFSLGAGFRFCNDGCPR